MNNFGNNSFGGLGNLDHGFTGLLDANGGSLSAGGGFGGGGMQNQNLIEQPYDFGLPASENQQAGAQTMKIRKLYMGLTRPQQAQHRRSYDAYIEGAGFEALQEKVDRFGQDAFSQVNISSVMATSDIIKPSGTAEAAVDIDNGWDRDRFMFVMVVDIYRNGKFQRTEFISGHTDHAGVEHADMISTINIDPNMVFSINHISEANMRNVNAQGQPIPMITATNSVLTNPNYKSFSNIEDDLYMMRPSDILRSVDKVEMYRGMAEATQQGVGSPVSFRDLDSTLSRMPMMSNDRSSLIPTFTSSILNGLAKTKLNEYDPMALDMPGNSQLASLRVQDTPFSKTGFVFIMQRTLANGIQQTSRFTFGDLMMLDQTIDSRTSVFDRSYETGEISFPDGRNTAIMGAGTVIATHATMISHTVLALMAIAGITTIGFNANNNAGSTELTWQACEGMDYDGMLPNRLEAFRARMIMECLNIISKEDQIGFKLDVFASALNDVFIQFSWDGEYAEYVFPAFASAVTLPIVTKDLNRLTGLAESVDSIVDMLTSRETGHQQQYGSNMFASGNGDTRIGGLAGDY